MRFRLRERGDDAAQQVAADARAAHGDDADLLAGPVAELVAQLLAVGDGLEPGHVAREVVVLLRPVADPGQLGAERVRHDVLRVADEDRPVADPREARDVLDHLGVVVGGQERLVLAAVLHRQPADEVGQPDVRRRLQLRVLVQEVVDLPGLVADPEVVVLVAHHVEEEHEVGDQDLVHPPDRLERMQVVLGRLALDVRRLVREQRARGMDPLALGLEHRRHRMLREPVDLEVGMELAQLLRDRDVAAGVAEPDRRGDVERAPAPAERPRPRPRLRRRRYDLVGELLQQAVHLHRVPRVGMCPAPSSPTNVPPVSSATVSARSRVWQLSSSPWTTSTGHRTRATRSRASSALANGGGASSSARTSDSHASVEPPPNAVLDLLRRVRLGELLREEELEEPAEVAPPVVDVPLGPALIGVERLGRRIAAVVRMSRRQAGTEGEIAATPSASAGSVAASMSA